MQLISNTVASTQPFMSTILVFSSCLKLQTFNSDEVLAKPGKQHGLYSGHLAAVTSQHVQAAQ